MFDRGVQALRDQADQQRRAARAATAPDVRLAEAERQLANAHRALADCDVQSDEYALLLRHVQQAERAYAALDASAMRAA